MSTKRTLNILREFRTLKKNRELLGQEQYVKELERLQRDIEADIASPELSPLDLKNLLQLLADQNAV